MMALQDELKAVYQTIAAVMGRLFKGNGQKFRYTKELFMAGVCCLAMTAGYVGYRWFTLSRDQTAQKAFSEYVQDYQLALKENNPQEWDRVSSLFAYGWDHYRSSSLAPYFLIMQSDIQLRQGNRAGAVDTITQALNVLNDASMQSLLKIKRALIQLDSSDQAMAEKGLQELIEQARDVLKDREPASYGNNSHRDMALFYLGRYYWAHNKIDEARKAWQELVDAEWLDKSNPSPWVNEARVTLQQLTK